MESLNGKYIERLKFQNSLLRIVDVVNFEGPLLTLFRDTISNNLYLFDWVDRDKLFNRWIVYRCNPDTLNQFIKSEISHYELFMSGESFCYLVDIDKDIVWNNFQEIIKQDLPESYLPQRDIFFEEVDCPNFFKLNAFITKQTTRKYSKEIVPKYSSRKFKIPNLVDSTYSSFSNNVYIFTNKSQYSDEINEIDYNYNIHRLGTNRTKVFQTNIKINSIEYA